MAYKALYRLYRPQTFDEVVGQNHILQTLKNAIKTNKIAHAYLFSGPRGTGKTSMAKLLAKAVNCSAAPEFRPCNECDHCKSIAAGTYPDVIEFDAASNNGVDEIRDIIDKVKYAPIEGQYKVYIIDEVHMMTASAYNAFLKTLEEPPSHVIFILATTEVHKVIPTILSRCQRFDFGRVSMNDLKKRITQVLTKEGVGFDAAVIQLVADLSEGGVRDALGILDQAIAYAGSTITEEDIRAIYGIASIETQMDFVHQLALGDIKAAYNYIDTWDSKGVDFVRLTVQLIDLLKDGLVFDRTHDETLLVHINKERAEMISQWWDATQLMAALDELMEVSANYRRVNAPRSYFELSMLKISQISRSKPILSAPVEFKIEPITAKQKTEIPPVNKEKVSQIVSRETKSDDTRVTDFSDTQLLGFLRTAGKEAKEKANERWALLDQYLSKSSFSKGANLLRGTTIFASTIDTVLLTCENSSQVNMINRIQNRPTIAALLQELFGKFVNFYAVTVSRVDLLKLQYRDRNEKKSLPDLFAISTPVEATASESIHSIDDAEALGRKLFGDLLEVKNGKN